MMSPWLLIPLVLFAFLFWGSLIVTLIICLGRFTIWSAGAVLHFAWWTVLTIFFAVWWCIDRKAAGAALKQAERERVAAARSR
jgi:hypothetical protein